MKDNKIENRSSKVFSNINGIGKVKIKGRPHY